MLRFKNTHNDLLFFNQECPDYPEKKGNDLNQFRYMKVFCLVLKRVFDFAITAELKK